MKNFNIKLVTELNDYDFINLYKEGGWWLDEYDNDISFIQPLINGSYIFAAAFNQQGKPIAIGRVISDGISDAYIQDVVVLKAYRKIGLGAAIIDFLVKELENRGIDWIALIAAPDTEVFYNKLNFKKMINFIPMKLQNQSSI